VSPASSRPDLTIKPLPSASSYRLITTWFSRVIFQQGTFTPLVHAHARRKQVNVTESQMLGQKPPIICLQKIVALMAAKDTLETFAIDF
jgi:hypothetical protein